MNQTEPITTAASTSSYTFTPSDYCANRLPCGICRLMQIQCPKWVQPITFTCKQSDGTYKPDQTLSMVVQHEID